MPGRGWQQLDPGPSPSSGRQRTRRSRPVFTRTGGVASSPSPINRVSGSCLLLDHRAVCQRSSQQKPPRFGGWRRSVGLRRGNRPFEASAEGLIESCKSFLERVRKWAGRLEEVIARASTEEEVCLQEIVPFAAVGSSRSSASHSSRCSGRGSTGVCCRRRSTPCRKSGMCCWQQPLQFCRGHPQCGWEMVHLL